jgi:hypothetical protein
MAAYLNDDPETCVAATTMAERAVMERTRLENEYRWGVVPLAPATVRLYKQVRVIEAYPFLLGGGQVLEFALWLCFGDSIGGLPKRPLYQVITKFQ